MTFSKLQMEYKLRKEVHKVLIYELKINWRRLYFLKYIFVKFPQKTKGIDIV